MPSEAVLGLAKFYKKPRPAQIPVMGENFRGMAEAIFAMQHAAREVCDDMICI